MIKQRNASKRCMAVLGVLMILTYAFFSCLPHSHECMGADCATCLMAEHSRDLLAGTSLTVASCLLLPIVYTVLCKHDGVLSVPQETPVVLKVKLSN